MAREEWRPIAGLEGLYSVSNYGRVKSLQKLVPYKGGKSLAMRKEQILSLGDDKDGYKIVNLSKNGARKTYKVHRIVATAFIPNLGDLPQVNHLDGDKTNNQVSNLSWCTCKENIQHKYRELGYSQKDTRKGVEVVLAQGKRKFPSIKSAARFLKVNPQTIRYRALNDWRKDRVIYIKA